MWEQAKRPIQKILVLSKHFPLDLQAEKELAYCSLEERRLFEQLDREMRGRQALGHEEHKRTVDIVEALRAKSKLSWLTADSPDDVSEELADLVLTVGGDGTFLAAAKHLREVPIFGLNSSPSTSTGHYCASTAEHFEARLGDILEGRVRPRSFSRLRVRVAGVECGDAILNEVLFSQRSPIRSTRYGLLVNGEAELHLSSGLWVSTASGSTGALMSAGGEPMKEGDLRLQYLVREPSRHYKPLPRLLQGYSKRVDIVSRSDNNVLYFDGHEDGISVSRRERVTITSDGAPLWTYTASQWG